MAKKSMFGSAFNGYSRADVDEYIEKILDDADIQINEKNNQILHLEKQIRDITQEKEELMKSTNVIDEEKNKIADVLIFAKLKADAMVKEAKMKAEEEKSEIENLVEKEKEKLVDLKVEIKSLKEELTESLKKYQDLFDNIIENENKAFVEGEKAENNIALENKIEEPIKTDITETGNVEETETVTKIENNENNDGSFLDINLDDDLEDFEKKPDREFDYVEEIVKTEPDKEIGLEISDEPETDANKDELDEEFDLVENFHEMSDFDKTEQNDDNNGIELSGIEEIDESDDFDEPKIIADIEKIEEIEEVEDDDIEFPGEDKEEIETDETDELDDSFEDFGEDEFDDLEINFELVDEENSEETTSDDKE